MAEAPVMTFNSGLEGAVAPEIILSEADGDAGPLSSAAAAWATSPVVPRDVSEAARAATSGSRGRSPPND